MEIKNLQGDVIFSCECKTLKKTVEEAVKLRVNLQGADLSQTDLSCTNLCGAKLSGSNLEGTNLCLTNLSGGNLSGAGLFWADLTEANLCRTNLSRTNLNKAIVSWANLSHANLTEASLFRTNFYGANLCGAILSKTNLCETNLYMANLFGVSGINPHYVTPQLMLKDQPGKIRAYKLVNENMEGPFKGGIKYEIGREVSVDNADTNDSVLCGKGISLATLDWCVREWKKGWKILIAEFEAKDIAAIPTATGGKFRVHRCKIVGEKNLQELGLVKGV